MALNQFHHSGADVQAAINDHVKAVCLGVGHQATRPKPSLYDLLTGNRPAQSHTDKETSTMTPAQPTPMAFVDGEPVTTERERDINRRYANLMGYKKPQHLRTETDEQALKAAQAKRRRKAEKRLAQAGH